MPLLHLLGSSLITSQRLPSMLLLQLPGNQKQEDSCHSVAATDLE